MPIIYLDNAATTRPLSIAINAFNSTTAYGNPSSAHFCGERARFWLEDARNRIAKCIGAKPEEVFFVSGATEGCAAVLRTLHDAGYYIEESPFEHHAVSENIPHPKGDRICDTKAFATMLVNNETGEIFTPKKENGFQKLFCDLTSAIGHIPVDVNDLGIDYGVFSAHKFGGFPGIGCVYAREGVPLEPMIYGGGQERGFRAGTESVALACTMAAALEWQCEHMESNMTHVHELNDLMCGLLIISGTDLLFNFREGMELSPYILNVSFPGVEGSALALMLSNEGVMVSTGAACTTGDNAPSHVLMAMYGDEVRARSAIRISFSHENTKEEVKTAAEKIVECVQRLRGLGRINLVEL